MSGNYDWLPPLLLLKDFNGDWPTYEAALYTAFRADFVDSKPTFRGTRLGLKRHPETEGKPCTYWHLISEGADEAERLPDMRRCERIRWPRPSIDNCDTAGVKVWETERTGETRITIWVEAEDYVVILAKRRDYVLPWTAFVLDQPHRRRKLQREFEASQAVKGAQKG